MWVLMKQGARSRESLIIIGCDSGGLTAGSSLAPVLVLQESGWSDTHKHTHMSVLL